MSAGEIAQAETTRPLLRGRLHQVAFIVSIPLGVTLVALGRDGLARAAGAVYAVSLMALYGVSAAYHRLPWSPRARAWMRRLDHSTIFVLIAGSYTPVALLVLRGAWRVSILATVWGVAIVGIALKMTRLERMHRIGPVMYIALGWTAIVALPRILGSVGPASIALMFAGGVLYTAGAVVFSLRRPDPAPRVFGYHEVWHSMVIAASLCHYALMMLLALGAG